MVVRARSLAVLAGIATLPLAAQAAKTPGPPEISCSEGLVSGINWGDGSSFGVPAVQVTKDPGPTQLPAVQFGCSNNMYSAGVEGDSFAVNFGNFYPPDPGFKYEVKMDTAYKEFVFDNPDGGLQKEYVSYFDLYINLYKENSDGFLVFDYKDFIGVKLNSLFGFAGGGEFKIMGDGSVRLDPSIPGGIGELFLYDTPQVPEPATLALVGSGVAAGVLRRKKRSKV